MFTRPQDLTDAQVREALGCGWGLDVTSVEHAPVGFGSHHWEVVTADGCRWFATADDLRTRRVGTDEPLTAPLAPADRRPGHGRSAARQRARLGRGTPPR